MAQSTCQRKGVLRIHEKLLVSNLSQKHHLSMPNEENYPPKFLLKNIHFFKGFFLPGIQVTRLYYAYFPSKVRFWHKPLTPLLQPGFSKEN